MFKKIGFLLLCAFLMLVTVGCSSDKKNFKKSANDYFAQFEKEQTAGQIKKEIKYTKKGGYAFTYPETSNQNFNKKLEEFCNKTVSEFEQKSNKGDTLFITYKSYSPCIDVFSVEMIVKSTVAGKSLQKSQIFNYAKGFDGMSEPLKKLICIELAGEDFKPKAEDIKNCLFKKASMSVFFEGDVIKDIPYTKIKVYLPKALKDSIKENCREIDITKKMVAITFDDGPHGTYTKEILDTLEKYDSVATFFEVGNIIEKNADLVKRADSLGCEIASHTWSHGNLKKLSLSKIQEQIDKTDQAIEAAIGKKPTLLRPPYGEVGSVLRENTDKLLIGWSVDTLDWQSRNKDAVVKVIKNEKDLDGDVVLMHSLYKSSAEAFAEIVPYLIENGYQLVTVSELVKYKYQDTLEAGKYYAYNYFDYKNND